MKKFIALLALATGLTVLTPGTAQAEHNRHGVRSLANNCGSCGSPVYRQLVVIGYNDCGEPIYRWRSASHRCQSRHGHGGHDYGHGGHGYSRGHFSTPRIHLDFGGHRRGY